MKFNLKADIHIEAVDLEDAKRKLSAIFALEYINMRDGTEVQSADAEYTGSLEVSPEDAG